MKHRLASCTGRGPGSGPAGPATPSPHPGRAKGPLLCARDTAQTPWATEGVSPHHHLAWPRHPAEWDFKSSRPQSRASNSIACAGGGGRGAIQLEPDSAISAACHLGRAGCLRGDGELTLYQGHSFHSWRTSAKGERFLEQSPNLSHFLSSFILLCPLGHKRQSQPVPLPGYSVAEEKWLCVSPAPRGAVFHPGPAIRPLTTISSAVTSPGSTVSGGERRGSQT